MADESYPQDLRYFKEHDWVRVEGGEATVSASPGSRRTPSATSSTPSLPDVGADGRPRARPTASSSRSSRCAEIFAPVSGEVVAVNEALQDEPQLVNDDRYGEGWLIRVRLTAPAELDDLMDADAYKEFLARRPERRREGVDASRERPDPS